jgi:Arc/MetJ-type ribon-helix-helix transcriptional regulator
MSLQLPHDLQTRVELQLSNGSYQNEEEVLRGALDALERDQTKSRRWHERNELAIEQSRQGMSKLIDDEAVLERLRQRAVKEGIGD